MHKAMKAQPNQPGDEQLLRIGAGPLEIEANPHPPDPGDYYRKQVEQEDKNGTD